MTGYVSPQSAMPGSVGKDTTPTPEELTKARNHAAQALELLMETTVPEDAVVALWLGSLSYAYGFSKGERANEIVGRHVKRFDARGLHPESVAWGAIQAAESLMPELAAECVATTPHALREAARMDAWTEHLESLGVAA